MRDEGAVHGDALGIERAHQDSAVGFRPSKPLAWGRADWFWLSGLALAIYAAYFRAVRFEFVFDDRPLILQNPLLLSWNSIPRFFTEHLVAFLHPHSQGTYYRPILSMWLLINRKAWALNPLAWHLSTLTLHVLATFVVFMLARRILACRFGAGLAALVFALHPAHVESAAWVMGLPDPLMTLFAVLALVLYLRARGSEDRNRLLWQAASWALYGLAILTKEVALVLPFLIFTYEWLFPLAPSRVHGRRKLSARFLQALRPVLPFLVVTAIYLVARWAAIGGLSHAVTPIPWRTLVATWPMVLWLHLRILLWPVGLCAFYDVPYVTNPGFANCALPLIALVACGLFLGWVSSKSPRAAFATVSLFLPMLLLLNLRVFPEGEILHDRFMYFPSVGFALLMGLGAEALVTSKGLKLSTKIARAALVFAAGVTLGVATFHYVGFWANDWTLYGRSLAIAPGNKLAANNLASDLADQGRYQEAIPLYRQILDRDQNYSLANYNLGYCLYKAGMYDEAAKYLTHAIALNPSEADAYMFLGMADFRSGRIPQAIRCLQKGIDLNPGNARYHFVLGVVLRSHGDLPAARQEFTAAVSLNPGLSDAREQLAQMDQQQRGK